MNPEQCCSNCKYGLEHEEPRTTVKYREPETRTITICRRFPDFVWRELDDWCGEYKEAG